MPVKNKKIDKPTANDVERKTDPTMNANVEIMNTFISDKNIIYNDLPQIAESSKSAPLQIIELPSAAGKKINALIMVNTYVSTVNANPNNKTVKYLDVNIFQRLTGLDNNIFIVPCENSDATIPAEAIIVNNVTSDIMPYALTMMPSRLPG